MYRIAKFEKVSFEQFKKDWIDEFPDYSEKLIEVVYENIKLPKRSSSGSAGNDFFSPITFILEPNETIKIPTGIRCYIEEGWVLKCYPRSGQGFKYRLQLNNTVGIIDQDFYYSDNEGHIMVKLTNDTNENKTIEVEMGVGMMQGIFVEYGITMDDVVSEIRNGGLGSSDKK